MILLVGPIPPPYVGQSISFKKLMDSLIIDKEINQEISHINTSPKNRNIVGRFSNFRAIETIRIIWSYFLVVFRKKPITIYLTKGSTKLGFLRDLSLLIIRDIFSCDSRFIVHLKGGNYDEFFHSSNFLFKKLIIYFLNRTNNIIVLGPSLLAMYDFHKFPKEKFIIIKNALTSDVHISDFFIKTKATTDKNKVRLLFLSNLIYSKGYIDLLKACEILINKGLTNFQLTYAGVFMESPDDPNIDINETQQKFLSVLQSSKFKENINYIGLVIGKEKDKLLRDSDIFLLPTNYHVEGQPVSIIEAMAYGCAIITTKYRSIPDITQEGKNTIYVEYGNPENISQAIEELIINNNKLNSFKKNSRVFFEEELTWRVHYSKMKNLLHHNLTQ